MPCPAGVNIPNCFSYYNDKHLFRELQFQLKYLGMCIGMDGGQPSQASLCRDCGKCEQHCPQDLPVREHLKEVSRDMEKLYYKPLTGLAAGYNKIRKLLKKNFQ